MSQIEVLPELVLKLSQFGEQPHLVVSVWCVTVSGVLSSVAFASSLISKESVNKLKPRVDVFELKNESLNGGTVQSLQCQYSGESDRHTYSAAVMSTHLA